MNKWSCIKLESFCTLKDIIIKTKAQLTERGKIFANHIFNKWLISKIYKYMKNSYNSATKNKQMGKNESEYSFSYIQMANKYIERLLLSCERHQDSWPPEKKNSIRGQWQGLITQSFCVIKFYLSIRRRKAKSKVNT